jgi:hypothetical protein
VATTTSKRGEQIQTWLDPQLAKAVRREAALERRSVSGLIRLLIEDRLSDERPR